MPFLNLIKSKIYSILLSNLLLLLSCSNSSDSTDPIPEPDQNPETFYLGADLSYTNEMEDCGAVYKNYEGAIEDPFKIFREAGANLVRVRLWHNPDWTNYSNLSDVKKTIGRAKKLGMKVLLDFHYSDTWADPHKQEIPAAWADQINNAEKLGQLLYAYTYNTLNDLSGENLLPDIVQVGNEINSMILQQGGSTGAITWSRNSYLLKKGIQAVRDLSTIKGKEIEVMLHIAQPENALWWFDQATKNGVTDFDWIGLSYYPAWSEYTLENLPNAIRILIETYQKRLMIVETAYPFTMENTDQANNILGNEALLSGYPATQKGQYDYLKDLYLSVKNAGGEGIIYWEPAWVSTDCGTLWAAHGSHWDNATLFDSNGKPTLGMQFYKDASTNQF